ncbi:MAG: efflux transporter, family, subunit, partial [Steroidobacteraceae bacterium]|nr:efflux transporter, family, subunit [Steroidobacteraceae bacterium]
ARGVSVVPVTALLEADGRAALVFVVAEGDHAMRVPVQTGRLLGDRIEIVTGLSPGDRVVTEGAAWLNDNDAVRVLDGG